MTPGISTLLLSDYHAGHHEGYRDRKFRALEAMKRVANETRVGEIVLAGDIADERGDERGVREECSALRDAIAGYESVFLHGNHDDSAYFDGAALGAMLRCRIDARPWHVSPVSGVAITHGHHFRTPSIRRALKTATREEHLDGLCERTKGHQKAMNTGFSVAGKVGDSLGEAGFPATELWEDLQQVSQRSRSAVALSLRRRRSPRRSRATRGSPGLLHRLGDRLADMIDLRSVRHAARLARAMGTWGVVSGHTHVPGLYKYHLKDETTGERIPFLVGNSGSFVSRYAPTFIEVRHPRMTLWQYDERTGRAVILQSLELSQEELAAQTRFFQCG